MCESSIAREVVTRPALSLARDEHVAWAAAVAGDRDAFAIVTARYRRERPVHCYRMLGSLDDAEDLVQETLLRAWRRRERFPGALDASRMVVRNRDERVPGCARPSRTPAASTCGHLSRRPAGAAATGERGRLAGAIPGSVARRARRRAGGPRRDARCPGHHRARVHGRDPRLAGLAQHRHVRERREPFVRRFSRPEYRELLEELDNRRQREVRGKAPSGTGGQDVLDGDRAQAGTTSSIGL